MNASQADGADPRAIISLAPFTTVNRPLVCSPVKFMIIFYTLFFAFFPTGYPAQRYVSFWRGYSNVASRLSRERMEAFEICLDPTAEMGIKQKIFEKFLEIEKTVKNFQ